MQIRHGTFRENQSKRKENQENCPESLHPFVRFLAFFQTLIAVLRCHECNGVERSGIKGKHREKKKSEHQRRQGKCFQTLHNRLIKGACLLIDGKHRKFPEYFQRKTIVSQHQKTHKRTAHPEEISAEDCLPYGSSSADASDKERRRHAPYHPVCPIEYRPVFRKMILSERVGIGRHRRKVLYHLPERGETVLQDEITRASEEENVKEKRIKKPGTGLCQKRNPRHPLQ